MTFRRDNPFFLAALGFAVTVAAIGAAAPAAGTAHPVARAAR